MWTRVRTQRAGLESQAPAASAPSNFLELFCWQELCTCRSPETALKKSTYTTKARPVTLNLPKVLKSTFQGQAYHG